ncbi:hypothetical protein EDC39_102142 [Geothermobacter ehrlichii]|uniref:Uncharacterized protein n=1 Tax=Geothermobacter ehrlichii TaxID=213224 RepID=A0A5D3WMA4_9BACT|nr:hypothetical protein [Geothermobacter ehrlichii]TYO99619.1 hypothetical protein EDC39_102142 [Geothermobacter ehrlichii]
MRMLILFLFGFVLVLAGCAPEAPRFYRPEPLPRLAGVIGGQLHLSGEVVVADDVRIAPGAELVIEPGTTLWIMPAGSTKIEPDFLSPRTEILVQGRLRIAGSEEEPVRFATLRPQLDVAPGDPLWAGIIVVDGGRAELSHVRLQAADYGLWLLEGEGRLRAVEFADCRYGIAVQAEGHLELADSLLRGGEIGLFCPGPGAVQLRQVRFDGQDEEGIHIGSSCRIAGEDVAVERARVGVAAAERPAFIRFGDNGRDFLRLRRRP